MNRWSLLVVVLVVVPARGQEAARQPAAVAYVRQLQAKDGGFKAAAEAPASSLRATSAALRALKYFGGELPDRAACVKFVEACHDKPSGGFGDRPGGMPDVFTTAVGIMAVNELKLSAEPYAGGVIKYLAAHARSFDEMRIAAAGFEAVGKHPLETEGWARDLRVKLFDQAVREAKKPTTGGESRELARILVTYLRMGGQMKPEPARDVVALLDAGQRLDGGFGKAGAKASDLESCYQVLRAYHMLRAQPNAAALRKFIAACRNDDGGYGAQPGQPSSVPATYYASILLHWLAVK